MVRDNRTGEDLGPLNMMGKVQVAQEAYGPLKIAEDIIGLLSTAVPTGPEPDENRRRNLRRDVVEFENPFDSDAFIDQIKRKINEFCKATGANPLAAQQICDLIDTDIAHKRYPNAHKKITNPATYFMDQTRAYLKRTYPW